MNMIYSLITIICMISNFYMFIKFIDEKPYRKIALHINSVIIILFSTIRIINTLLLIPTDYPTILLGSIIILTICSTAFFTFFTAFEFSFAEDKYYEWNFYSGIEEEENE